MLIGISGIAGAGKDTCADVLVRERNFVKVALADPIKRAARDIFAFTDDQLWGPSEMRNAPDKRYRREHTWKLTLDGTVCECCGARGMFRNDHEQCFLTPRFALQQLGTEWGRHLYSNVWVEYALRVVDKLADGDHLYFADGGVATVPPPPRVRSGAQRRSVVVPDLRFKNEIDAFRAAGAKLVRIVRTGSALGGGVSQHVSETEQRDIPDSAFDVVIVNDSTVEELWQKALAALAGWTA